MTAEMLAVPEFLTTPAGIAVLAVVAALLVILILELNYRFFAKYLLDFIFALITAIVLSPVLAVTALISKVKYGSVFDYESCVGVKGKVIYVRSFTGINGGLKYLPRILDVLSGRMSFVGPKLVDAGDAALMDDEAMSRFSVRPGIVCPLVTRGHSGLTYEEMFEIDARYIKKREMFTDFGMLLRAFVYKMRGEEMTCYGETVKSYAAVLLDRGAITENDVITARDYAEQSVRNTTFR